MILDHELVTQARALLTEEQNANFTDHDVMRFIIARKGNIKKSHAMMEHYHEWYDKVLHGSEKLTPRNILSQPDPDEHIYQKYFHHSNLGFSKKGCPIYWEKTGMCSANFPTVTKSIPCDGLIIRHVRQQEIVFTQRCKRASEFYGKPVTKQTIVFDLKGLVYSLDTNALSTFRACLKIDEAYYPERLDHFFMINVPWYFTALWAIVKPWIDPVTAEKFVLLGSDYLDTLKKYIDESQIPTELGGKRENFGWTFPENSIDSDEILAAACPDRPIHPMKEGTEAEKIDAAENSTVTEELKTGALKEEAK